MPKSTLCKIAEEEQEILELKKANDKAEKKAVELHAHLKAKYLAAQYSLTIIRKNQALLTKRMRTIQIAKMSMQQPLVAPEQPTSIVRDPKRHGGRKVQFNLPSRAPAPVYLGAPYWRPLPAEV